MVNNLKLYNLDYVSLKETIELDKTLSKYRSEISNIITGSIIKNRTNPPAPLASDIIYTGTTFNKPTTSKPNSNVETVSTLYCPRPAESKPSTRSSFMDVFKSTFTRSVQPTTSQVDTDSPYYQLSQIRGGHADLRNRLANRNKANPDVEPIAAPLKPKKAHPTPIKEPNSFLSWVSSFFQRRVMPAVSYAGLKFSQLLPYIVFIIFTIIVLEYARVKFINNPTSFLNRMDEDGQYEYENNAHTVKKHAFY